MSEPRPSAPRRSGAGTGRHRWSSALALSFSLAAGGSIVLVSESHHQVSQVKTDTQVVAALQTADPGAEVENFLLVGSDSRAGSDPNSPDFGGIGNADSTTGARSDTIMVLRHNRVTGEAAILSFPRDLWVNIAGSTKQNRINSAFSKGTDVLVKTITEDFGIPINHYVEVDFNGFKKLVDAIGGVNTCFDYPTRDKNTGLMIAVPGCYDLNGLQGLEYARSRHFEQFKDGHWHEDPLSDLGRIDRQQKFIVAAVTKARGKLSENPYVIKDLIAAAQESVTIDKGLDLITVAKRFGDLVGQHLLTLQVPVTGKVIDGNDVLLMDQAKAKPILDYFRGVAPAAATGSTVAGSTDPGASTAPVGTAASGLSPVVTTASSSVDTSAAPTGSATSAP